MRSRVKYKKLSVPDADTSGSQTAFLVIYSTVRTSDHLHFVCLSSFGWQTYFSFTHSEKKMQVLIWGVE